MKHFASSSRGPCAAGQRRGCECESLLHERGGAGSKFLGEVSLTDRSRKEARKQGGEGEHSFHSLLAPCGLTCRPPLRFRPPARPPSPPPLFYSALTVVVVVVRPTLLADGVISVTELNAAAWPVSLYVRPSTAFSRRVLRPRRRRRRRSPLEYSPSCYS